MKSTLKTTVLVGAAALLRTAMIALALNAPAMAQEPTTALNLILACTGSEEGSGTFRPLAPPPEPNTHNHVNINIVIADNAVAVDEFGQFPSFKQHLPLSSLQVSKKL